MIASVWTENKSISLHLFDIFVELVPPRRRAPVWHRRSSSRVRHRRSSHSRPRRSSCVRRRRSSSHVRHRRSSSHRWRPPTNWRVHEHRRRKASRLCVKCCLALLRVHQVIRFNVGLVLVTSVMLASDAEAVMREETITIVAKIPLFP